VFEIKRIKDSAEQLRRAVGNATGDAWRDIPIAFQ
jgi:hypothetical protein